MGKRSAKRKRAKGAKPRRRVNRPLKRPQQLELTRAARGHGGPRSGAGRKPGPGRQKVPHRRRATVCRDRPQHVTLRLAAGLPRLRRARAFRALRSCFAAGHKTWFRVVHFSVMTNHLHLIVEADDRQALGRGMQGLKIRIAKRLNRAWGRSGTVFSERYHAREMSTPTQVRNGLCYVLSNARRHAKQSGRTLSPRWVDPYSSARQFDGWRQRVRSEPGVVEAPQSWLLQRGWRRRGLLDAHAVPTGPPT